jgi:hypothetical protein
MKNIHIFTLVLIYILVNNKTTYGQSGPEDTSQVIFSNQDALDGELAKFGLKTLEFSEGANCVRQGKPLTKRRLGDLKFEVDLNPVKKTFGDVETDTWPKVEGDINIYWIHGLNGSTESLAVPAQATQIGAPGFDARKVTSIRGVPSSGSHSVQYYSEDRGISYATNDLNTVNNALVPLAKRTPRDYIIAHSQGGIVAREWLRNMEQKPNMYDKFAHGMVTFGTPHGGAEVLNNTRPNLGNKVPMFMDEACNAIGKALLEDMVKDNFLTRLLISQNLKSKITDKACEFVGKTVVPLALDNYYKRTTEDYYVGSPFLKGYNDANGHVEGLSEYTLKVPVVQFYGEEEQPILWRFLSSTVNIGHDKLDNNEMIFGYNQDDQMGLKAMDLADKFYTKCIDEEEEVKRMEKKIMRRTLSFFSIPQKALKNAKENIITYRNAYTWVLNANDYYLTDLIGGRQEKKVLSHCYVVDNIQCRDMSKNAPSSGLPPVFITKSYTVGVDASGINCLYTPISVLYNNYSFPGLDGTTWVGNCTGSQSGTAVWKTTGTYKPNDGVVLAESASAELKTNAPNHIKNTYVRVKMAETNHDQMKNCTQTKLALIQLYNGGHGTFFKVDKR